MYIKKPLLLVIGILLCASVAAKLPAPSEEAKAKADEAKAKTAWTDKVASYQLCKAQDRVAAYYLKSKAAPTPTAATTGIPPCADPGPYVAAQVATKVGVADSLPLNKEPIKK
ncbi:hypothetical protein RCH09_003030 [Actimicrobium sp. GrIS 1.19]|uniref:hypothetical protein n=1 Tax=Actimicrobium sp. GrIS 1.19 TaxID=3071708 RepID=UPI002E0137C0|nr:hypothetical protein [Actimicrobium sp. GrIS 1.19]